MKTLFIMRHAKSNWDNPDLSDFDRPLSSQGLQEAPFMANILFKNSLQPELIIASPAKRAKQTAVLGKEVAEVKSGIDFKEKIYEASPTALLSVFFEVSDKYESIMLIGHNPGIEGLIRVLTGEIQPMPTASIAKISLNIEKWSEITTNCGLLELVIRPQDLIERVAIKN